MGLGNVEQVCLQADANLAMLPVGGGRYLDAQISNGAIMIRPFRMQDAPALLEAVRESIKEICTWMVWCHPDYGHEDSVKFIASCAGDWQQGNRYSFVVLDQDNGTFLGSVGLSEFDATRKAANLGYWVRT